MSVDLTDLVRPDRLGPSLVRATGEQAWLDLSVELISGGRSNLTFILQSDAGSLILRRPPTGTLLPSAHDMIRETRVQLALRGTAVPVPRILLVDEGSITGVPCYVMERVPGHVLRADLPEAFAETAADRRALAFCFLDTLAELHAVDFEAVGLSDYGRPVGHLERQVRRWTGQWEASRTREVPELDELARRLAAQFPQGQRSSIVHGDYRLDNVVLSAEAPVRVSAVLDWELSTLGDPLTDVGLLSLYWRDADDPQLGLIPGVTCLPGFPSRAEMLARYEAVSGADMTNMSWYEALAHFKFAVIAQGIQVRAQAGDMAGQDFGDLDDQISFLAGRGLELV